MPKVTASHLPLSGIFAIDKPSGVVTMSLLNSLNTLLSSSPLFLPAADNHGNNKRNKYQKRRRGHHRDRKVKLGQGGTLDPLASGVLGINDGTKRLSDFLNGTKEYRAVGLFGSATDSYDSEGKRVRDAAWQHVTREKVEAVLDRFRGEIKQLPPIYSAIKMDGKPLYEYARQNLPLPRPIEARSCNVFNLELTDWKEGAQHNFRAPTAEVSEEERAMMEKLESMVQANSGEGVKVKPADPAVAPDAEGDKPSYPDAPGLNSGDYKSEAKEAAQEGKPAQTDTGDSQVAISTEQSEDEITKDIPPTFEIKMTVSSGTYVRSLVHDIGLAVGSAAHVVVLERTRQGQFALDLSNITQVKGEDTADEVHGVVPWEVFQAGLDAKAQSKGPDKQEAEDAGEGGDGVGELPWEKAIMDALHQT